MSKPTFRVESADANQFVVVRFDRGWFKQHRTVLSSWERLQDAELSLCAELEKQFMRELDQKYYRADEYDVTVLYPTAKEEPIYTALVLAGHPPASANEVYSHHEKDDILEKMLGRRMEMVERRMFENRYMTWFVSQQPEYKDPRRNSNYGNLDFAPLRDPYNRRALNTTSTQSAMSGAYRALVNKITGRTP